MNTNINSNTGSNEVTGARQGTEANPTASRPPSSDGSLLLDDLAALLRRYVVLPNWAAEALALWVVHTHSFQLREVSTYLGIESPEKRCGKTTLLTVLAELVNRPVVAANISSPAFFRVIQETQPTLLIDEADTFLQGNEELRGILNSGYTRKTAYVWRAVANAEFRMDNAGSAAPNRDNNRQDSRRIESGVAKFSCWCPKVMAAIGRLPDTLADRCILIRMQRKSIHEECERLRHLDASGLRQRSESFVTQHAEAIRNASPAIPEELNDRAADLWEPLLALADLAGGEWPERSRQAAIALSAIAQEGNPAATLLMDICWLFLRTNEERFFSRTIVAWLNQRLDRPWAEARKGRGVDELWLSQRLRPYDVRPKTIRIGEDRAKGYEMETLKEVFRRYIPKAEVDSLLQDARA